MYHGPDWWFQVQMVFLENKEDEPGVDKIYRGKPFLWVDMDFVQHGRREYVEPGCVWRDLNQKLLNLSAGQLCNLQARPMHVVTLTAIYRLRTIVDDARALR